MADTDEPTGAEPDCSDTTYTVGTDAIAESVSAVEHPKKVQLCVVLRHDNEGERGEKERQDAHHKLPRKGRDENARYTG